MSHSRTIDVHAHFLPPAYRDALQAAGLTLLDGGMPVPSWSPESAIAIMDELGISGAVLSISSPHASFLGGQAAAELCRAINDYAGDLRRQRPDRFGAYAILPLPDVDASLAELDRALGDLELDGVALPTHADGAYLGDARFAPLLQALDHRGATVFIHPTSPPCFEAFGLALPAPMIEFPFDTTRTVVSLLYSGALARHPRINFIVPHAGGTLPFLAPRIAGIGASPVLGDRAVPLPDSLQALARLHYDIALSAAPQQLAALRAIAPVSQILYGSDYPFANEQILRVVDALFAASAFTHEEKEIVRCDDAARLFPTFASRCCGHGHGEG
jgi:predicted TIM-barrel fold metal-dependent hydrolase